MKSKSPNLLAFCVLWVILGLIQGQAAWAQSKVEATEIKIQSIFIYNFTKYINWPEEYNRGDFVIGVLGDADLTEELYKMAKTKNVGNRRMVVKKYAEVADIEGRCHILFIPAGSSSLLSSALKKTKGQPTLVITHKDGLGRAGSQINFVSSNGKFRFEININALEKNGLKCAQQLKSLAIII
jgi:hypothetical protein